MTYLIVFLVFALVMLGMAVGVMVHGRSIKGSCGGLNNAGGCSLCSGDQAGACRRPGEQA